MWNIFKGRDKYIKGKLIDQIIRRVFMLADIRDKLKKEYQDGLITEWTYYKQYWIVEGELIASRSFKKALED